MGVVTMTQTRPLKRRYLMKFAHPRAPSSETEHIIVAIDVRGTTLHGSDDKWVSPSVVRVGLIEANEVRRRLEYSYWSLAEMLISDPDWASRTAETIPRGNTCILRAYRFTVSVYAAEYRP